MANSMLTLMSTAAVVVAVMTIPTAGATAPDGKRNVLFLVSDDMRPQLNRAYGQAFMHTPNLDQLASESMVFDRHYTNFAICSASRNSFMSGRMPDKTQVWNFITHFRESKYWDNATDVTFPQYFKNAGYVTLAAGKLFHPNKPPNNDEPFSWSQERPYFPPYKGGSWSCGEKSSVCVEPNHPNPNESLDGFFQDGIRFADYNESMETVTTIMLAAKTVNDTGQPFFVGLGVTKPHYSWNIPEYFFSMYEHAQPPLATHQFAPKDVPDIAFTAEFDGMPNLTVTGPGIPGVPGSLGPATFPMPYPGNNTFPRWFQRALRNGYWSAISMADHHLGIALDALQESGVGQHTLTVFTADHGYQLGEHTEWAKHTNFELGTHVPLMIRAPWIAGSAGKHTSQFTTLIDLYRTVSSLAGLAPPPSSVDGVDVSQLLTQPNVAINEAAYSQYSRCPGDRYWPSVIKGAAAYVMNNCEEVPAQNITSMGYSVRVTGWRYTEWFGWDGNTCRPTFEKGPIFGKELYEHNDSVTFPIDFDCCENQNVVAAPEHADLIVKLHNMILAKYDIADMTKGCPIPSDTTPSLESD
eukprot:m.236607 g.236607  ORF g.236607 m.236607 type:complete len:581 (-) comp33689_c0_seq1:77-1819(-)